MLNVWKLPDAANLSTWSTLSWWMQSSSTVLRTVGGLLIAKEYSIFSRSMMKLASENEGSLRTSSAAVLAVSSWGNVADFLPTVFDLGFRFSDARLEYNWLLRDLGNDLDELPLKIGSIDNWSSFNVQIQFTRNIGCWVLRWSTFFVFNPCNDLVESLIKVLENILFKVTIERQDPSSVIKWLLL